MSIKPYYMIDFSASACMFEIRINDYPVITQNIEGQVSTYIPINYAVLESGEQVVSATMLPLLGETTIHPKANLRFKIMLFDVTNDFVYQEQFKEYQSVIDFNKKLPVLKYAVTFIAEIPYVLKAWQNGQDLSKIKEVSEKLVVAYQYIGRLINNKRYDTFKAIIERRENNMATSMYLSTQETQSRVLGLISDFKSGFKVMPISKGVVVQIYGNGKVAALKKINGESALYLYNEETKEELMLDITFYIPEGKTAFEVI